MSVQETLESKLNTALTTHYLEVVNESCSHRVPEDSETHFRVTIASEDFANMRKVARHQKVYQILAEELAGPVHALALHTYTPAEWQELGNAPATPKCM